MRVISSRSNERGMALVTTLLVMMLITGLMAGAFAAIAADQRSNALDRDQTQAYAAAHAGLEKLTSDLSQLFAGNFAPTGAQVNALEANPPALAGFEYRAPGGAPGSGYAVEFLTDANGNPRAEANLDITAGPYQGFKGFITKYTATVTARSLGGAEVRLRREVQTVAVPVFQFGVFSQGDLTFLSGDNFGFGGRVHTNSNLFLNGTPPGFSQTFSDRITAVNEVVRSHFANGQAITAMGFTGNVNIYVTPGNAATARNLRYTGPNEGSVTGALGSPRNASWTTISTGTYKSTIRTGLTGAKRLDLPLVDQGAAPIDLIRRPAPGGNEHVNRPEIFQQRFYSQASLRILLSDRQTDFDGLPTITADPAVALTGDWVTAPPAGYGPVDATHPPAARSVGLILNRTAGGTYAAPFADIYVEGNIDAGFKIPTAGTGLTVTSALGTMNNVVCTGKTATTLIGCNLVGGIAANGSVSVTMPSGVTVTAPTTLAVAAGPNATITLSAGATPYPTAPLSLGLIWVNGAAVTCEGYNTALAPQRFTRCRGLTAVPANPGAGVFNISTHAHAAAGDALLGGLIKIEKQNAAGVWSDVTMEILNLGIGARNQDGTLCADPTPNAVLRIQRLRDNGNAAGQGGGCTYSQSRHYYDWWPNQLFDTREGNRRDVPTNDPVVMGGVMSYIALDVNNLRQWFAGTIGTTGAQAKNNQGYIVYFSDRRGDHQENGADTVDDPETAEYGFEDFVNPNSATGVPNDVLDAGEDMNNDGSAVVGDGLVNPATGRVAGNLRLETYGQTPHILAIPAGLPGAGAPGVPAAGSQYLAANARPWTTLTHAEARVNKVVLFRRALMLINGGINGANNNLPADGLTVAAENPLYIKGNYNATATIPAADPNVPAAVMADAVTLLSNNWSDANSFRNPNNSTLRGSLTTGFRVAVIAGKGLSFPWFASLNSRLNGTDGGVGNFLRLLEDWNANGQSINYRGSIVSLFTSRQAVGTWKWGQAPPNVYVYGARNFQFDQDFLVPTQLPPGTPMFRDVNTLTFRQILRPNQ